ncbi:MAG: hypothetical protein HRT38_14530 [Alteromonadaceae bacterium]|nr:hypothetical protein [Alteromonadaceae bacterium]
MKVDEAKAFIEAAEILIEEGVLRVDEAWYIRDRFWTLDTDNHRTQLYDNAVVDQLRLAYKAIQYKDLELNFQRNRQSASTCLYPRLFTSYWYVR